MNSGTPERLPIICAEYVALVLYININISWIEKKKLFWPFLEFVESNHIL